MGYFWAKRRLTQTEAPRGVTLDSLDLKEDRQLGEQIAEWLYVMGPSHVGAVSRHFKIPAVEALFALRFSPHLERIGHGTIESPYRWKVKEC